MALEPADWKRLDRALMDALELPEEQRPEFLRTRLAGRPDLVEAALAGLADESSDPSIQRLAPDLVDDLATTSRRQEQASWRGRRVGPWRILEPIGHGGMGAVFLAERADGAFERQVALKLLPISLQSDEMVRRFEQERRIAARLNHPGIAQLLDGGTTGDGSPYLVLELVEGVPITEYCDRHALNVDQRLQLLLQVCAAVQFAHRNLVVHRDLKPDNILIDREGRVRLLDFGIARIMEDMSPAHSTEPLSARLTPDYAAPEQFTGDIITAATDVYALGCLAYRLLVGRVAIELTGKPLAKMLEALQQGERTGILKLAENVELPPGVRRPDLGHDLAAIASKAVHPEADRRYGSAGEFAADLERLRDGLPVSARRQGRWYLVSRFIGRHRKGLIATAAAFSMLLLSASVALYQAGQARQQRDEAQAVAGMLKGLMQLANPDTGIGHQVDAHTMLRASLETAIGELNAAPATRIELLETLAEALLAFELADDALRARREIHALQLQRHGPEHPETLTALRQFAIALREQRRNFDECERLFKRLLETRRAILGEAHLDTAESYRDLGFLYLRYSDSAHPGRARSLELLGKAHSIYVQRLGPDHPLAGHTLFELGLATEDKVLRIERMQRGIGIRERHAEPDDLVLLQHQGDLAMVLSDSGRVEEGLALGRRALEGHQAARGELHPISIILQNNLAGMYRDHGHYEKALSMYLRVDELVRATVPENHLRRAFSQFGIGRSMCSLGRPAEADPYLRAAIDILEHNRRDHLVGVTRIELGDCLLARGQASAAAAEYRQALDIYLQRLGRSDQDEQVRSLRQRLAAL
ncbi:MAG: hypothetical protein CMP07_01840 [Xanthomonadales bacterium]|nr:hypothetical protein [Xanthomonadales bacterium]